MQTTAYYHYRRMSQSGKTLIFREKMLIKINWSKLLDTVAWISCGYGVRPRYTVFLSCLSDRTLCPSLLDGRRHCGRAAKRCRHQLRFAKALNFLDNVYFSTMVFTAKTQVKWFPVGVFRYLSTVESVLGWLLLPSSW